MEPIWIPAPAGRIFGMSAGPSDGPLVLGLHGWSQRNGWHVWQPLLAPLAAAGHRAVSVDMPGWGQSPAWGNGLDGPAAVAVVVAILDGLGATVATLMGKSWGGGVAVATAARHPERVKALILTAPALRPGEDYGQVRQPVLVAWAEDDQVIPIVHAGRMQTQLPQAQLVRYPTGGHNAAPVNAADFAPRAVAFLQGLRRHSARA